MRLTLLALSLTTACDPNFTVSRGDLGPFRVAGLGVTERTDGQWVASAAVYSGLGLYHEASPTLSWTLDGEALGEGYDVLVPGPGTLGLVCTNADGDSLTGEVTATAPPAALSLARQQVSLGDDLSLTARRDAPVEDVELGVPEGSAERLTLQAEPELDSVYSASWMLSQGRGTALEVYDLAADVLAEEVVWDDGAVDSRTPVDLGLFHALALVRDGAGSNAWVWADAAIGADGAYLRHEGRLLPLTQADGAEVAAEAAAQGWALATLQASGDEAGVALVDVVAAPEVDGAPDLSGQDVLSCAPGGEPFRLAWLAEGRCALDDVLGATVLLEVW